jgi:hypothetical protein
MTTRGEILTTKYLEFKNSIENEQLRELFPNLEDYDISDVVIFLENFDDLNNIQSTVEYLLEFSGKSALKEKLPEVYPKIEEFILFYFKLKKL